LSDLEIEYVPTRTPGGIPVKVWNATVASMERLAPDVMRVMLRVEGAERISFYAGQ
jgi:NAD(P)H-flavin reductase